MDLSRQEGLTLAPLAAVGVQVVWVEPLRLVQAVQNFPDVHHLIGTRGERGNGKACGHRGRDLRVGRRASVYLLRKLRVSRKLAEVHELQMQGAVLGQDAAAARCPRPISAYATEKDDRNTDV